MAVRELATSEEALERISELEEELESLDALLLLMNAPPATTTRGTLSPTLRGNSTPRICSTADCHKG